MKTKHVLIFFLMAVCYLPLESCTKDQVNSNTHPGFNMKLYKSWNWIESSGGLAGKTITPVSAGYSLAIEFRSTGICKRFKNGQLQSETTFVINKGTSIYNPDSVDLIKYSDNYPVQSFGFGGQDTLY